MGRKVKLPDNSGNAKSFRWAIEMNTCQNLFDEQGKIIKAQDESKVIEQLLQGLQDMVNADVAHLDIKPSNIMILDGIVKYIDFGFSRTHHEIDIGCGKRYHFGSPVYHSPLANRMQSLIDIGSPTLVHGTIYYLQRNLLQAEQKAADIWSLGVVLTNHFSQPAKHPSQAR